MQAYRKENINKFAIGQEGQFDWNKVMIHRGKFQENRLEKQTRQFVKDLAFQVNMYALTLKQQGVINNFYGMEGYNLDD